MILYFSTTGNSKFIAKKLGEELSMPTLDMFPYVKENKELVIDDNSPLIICTPIYICSIPTFLVNFLKKLKVTNAKECYFVFTSGGYDGIAPHHGKKIARKLKLKYKGSYNITMPRNYTASKHYPVFGKEESLQRINAAIEKISSVIQTIKNGDKLKHRHVFLLEYLIILPFIPIYSKRKLITKEFYTTDKCIGCGLCQKECPLNIISMKDNKPCWTKTNCSHCMGCINNCPREAIEYGNITKGLPRYTYNKVTKE